MKENTFRNIFANVLIFVVICIIIVQGVNLGSPNATEVGVSPIYNGNKEKANVSLMVNVYWGTEYIKPMLEVFKEYDATTTFFIGGVWAMNNQELLKEIRDCGHEIGSHGYYHKDMSKMSYEANYKEIKNTNALLSSILGQDIVLFAPPSGAFNESTVKACNDLEMKTIMWSKDTIDWRDKNSDIIFSRATKNISSGDFVLMHPTEKTLEALPKILENYKENNIQVTTVSKNIEE